MLVLSQHYKINMPVLDTRNFLMLKSISLKNGLPHAIKPNIHAIQPTNILTVAYSLNYCRISSILLFFSLHLFRKSAITLPSLKMVLIRAEIEIMLHFITSEFYCTCVLCRVCTLSHAIARLFNVFPLLQF